MFSVICLLVFKDRNFNPFLRFSETARSLKENGAETDGLTNEKAKIFATCLRVKVFYPFCL